MIKLVWAAALIALVANMALSGSGNSPVLALQESQAFDPATFGFGLEEIATGFDAPVYVTGPNDGSGRLFVVEQPGRIRIIVDGATLADPFLDISGIVQSSGSEQGLLSMAFPNDYSESGQFYVYFTARSEEGVGDNTISQYRVSADDPNLADPESGKILLRIPDFRVNHNGGQLQFGPDGFLYAGLGDGGGGGDPENNAQDPSTLFGSLLRIDPVPRTGTYEIPRDNPFANGGAGAPEVWAWGLRNPWRFSFDRESGDLLLGDVGQGQLEEVNWLPAGSVGGINFGWNLFEGTSCFRSDSCDAQGLTQPVADYSHEFGCSVVGGYVYRGEREPSLDGIYLFADFCSGLVWGMGRDESGTWVLSQPTETGLSITSFGEDADGEIYITAMSGQVLRVTEP